MDKQVQSLQVKNIDDFLDSISNTLNLVKEHNMKMQELQSLIALNSKDYHTIQSIVDIIVSMPENGTFAPFAEIKKALLFTS
ncbi:hypothetical protein ACR1PO_03095 [Chryseobacterium sp. RRHN12]